MYSLDKKNTQKYHEKISGFTVLYSLHQRVDVKKTTTKNVVML